MCGSNLKKKIKKDRHAPYGNWKAQEGKRVSRA